MAKEKFSLFKLSSSLYTIFFLFMFFLMPGFVLPSASAAIEFYNFSDDKQGEIKNLIIENNDINIK